MARTIATLLVLLCLALPPATAGETKELLGIWVWAADSDGQTPVKGAVCTLDLQAGGQLAFHAFRPGEEFSDEGHWSVSAGGRISLEIPTLGLKVEGKPFALQAGELTLPFTLINQVPGTSRWRRQESRPVNPDDFIAVAYRAYQEALEAGASDEAAADSALTALRGRPFSARRQVPGWGVFARHRDSPPGLLHAAPAPATLDQVVLNAQKTALRIRREKGGRTYYCILRPKMPKRADYRAAPGAADQPLQPGFFARDPRTHLFMKPGPGRGDPPRHTAALLFPMNSRRNFRKGQYFTFRGLGEDPQSLRRQLLRAGYAAGDIEILTDGAAGPQALARALRGNPGLFYVSSHGVQIPMDDGRPGYLMATGTQVTTRAGETMEQALVRAVRAELAAGLPAYLANTMAPVTVQRDRWDYDTYLGVCNPFFEELRLQGGMDLAATLAYVDACESAAPGSAADPVPPAVNLFRARSFVGWKTTSDPMVGVRYVQHFFEQAVRKTHSAREIWDHMVRVLSTRQSMVTEDKLLDSDLSTDRAKIASEIAIFMAFDADGKPYPRLSDVVHWLVWLGRWNQDPEKASANLRSCYQNAWAKKKRGLGTSPLCNSGYLGSHVPTAVEVDEARRLISGEPAPVPGGRWTLADKLPYEK